jgi:membrane protease YdiL (CAAX protease family)
MFSGNPPSDTTPSCLIYMKVLTETSSDIATHQVQQRSPLHELIEVGVAFGLVEGALWSTRPTQLIWVLLAALWVTVATLRSRRTAAELGITTAGLRSSLWVIPAAIAVCGLILLGAWQAGTLHVLTGTHKPLWHAALYAIWAFVQEFLALSFIYMRFEAALGSWRSLFWTALLFSLAHIPSPILMGATFLLGLAFTALFRRYRSIYPLGLAHALLGLTLAISTPPGITHNMRVGIAWWVR